MSLLTRILYVIGAVVTTTVAGWALGDGVVQTGLWLMVVLLFFRPVWLWLVSAQESSADTWRAVAIGGVFATITLWFTRDLIAPQFGRSMGMAMAAVVAVGVVAAYAAIVYRRARNVATR